MDWTEQNANELIEGIYSGEFTLDRLPRFLFEMTFGSIIPLIEKAFKGGVETIPAGTVRHQIAVSLRENINVFSGAKTWQEARALTEMVYLPDGSKRPFAEFLGFARGIDDQYNKNWLKVEQDAAFARTQAADRWLEIEEQKEILPLLQYMTVADDRVRPDHRDQDGVVRPVDDKYWDTWFPPNDWGCRCDVDQLEDEDAEITPMDKVPANPVKLFNDNPGKSHVVFQREGGARHPYFKVEDRFKVEMDRDNFGLGYL